MSTRTPGRSSVWTRMKTCSREYGLYYTGGRAEGSEGPRLDRLHSRRWETGSETWAKQATTSYRKMRAVQVKDYNAPGERGRPKKGRCASYHQRRQSGVQRNGWTW